MYIYIYFFFDVSGCCLIDRQVCVGNFNVFVLITQMLSYSPNYYSVCGCFCFHNFLVHYNFVTFIQQ